MAKNDNFRSRIDDIKKNPDYSQEKRLDLILSLMDDINKVLPDENKIMGYKPVVGGRYSLGRSDEYWYHQYAVEYLSKIEGALSSLGKAEEDLIKAEQKQINEENEVIKTAADTTIKSIEETTAKIKKEVSKKPVATKKTTGKTPKTSIEFVKRTSSDTSATSSLLSKTASNKGWQDVFTGRALKTKTDKLFGSDKTNKANFAKMAENAQKNEIVMDKMLEKFEHNIEQYGGAVTYSINKATDEVTIFIHSPGEDISKMDVAARMNVPHVVIGMNPSSNVSKGMMANQGINIHTGQGGNYAVDPYTDVVSALLDSSSKAFFAKALKSGDKFTVRSAVSNAAARGARGLTAYGTAGVHKDEDVREEHRSDRSNGQSARENREGKTIIEGALLDLIKMRQKEFRTALPANYRNRKKRDQNTFIYGQLDEITRYLTGASDKDAALSVIEHDPAYDWLTKDTRLWSGVKRDMQLFWNTHSTGGMGSDTNKKAGVIQYAANSSVWFAGKNDSSRHLSQATVIGENYGGHINERDKRRLITASGVRRGHRTDTAEEQTADIAYVSKKEVADAFRAFKAEKMLQGMSEEEFVARYGMTAPGLEKDAGIINKKFLTEEKNYTRDRSKELSSSDIAKLKKKHKNWDDLTDEEKAQFAAEYFYKGKIESQDVLEPVLEEIVNRKGEKVTNLKFKERVRIGSGEKLTGATTGDRSTYNAQGATVEDAEEMFKFMRKEMGLGDNVQVLREAREFKLNQLSGILGGVIEYAAKMQYDKGNLQGFVDILNKDPNSPLKGLVKLDKDGRIILDDDYEKMQKLDMAQVVKFLSGDQLKLLETVEENGEVVGFKQGSGLGGHLVISEALNATNLYPYTNKVKVGEKERDAASRAIATSKNRRTNKNFKELEDHIQKSMKVDEADEDVKIAKQNKERVEQAIRDTVSIQTKEQLESELGDKAISIGFGEGYDIDMTDIINETPDYANMTEDERQKLFFGQIAKYKEDLKSKGIKDVDSYKYYVDIGQDFGEGVEYDNGTKRGFKGRYLFIPDMIPQETGTVIDEETGEEKSTYDIPQFTKSVNAVLHAINEGDADRAAERATGAFETMVETIESKNGAIYQMLNSRRVDDSKTFKAQALNRADLENLSPELRKIYETGAMFSREDMAEFFGQGDLKDKDYEELLLSNLKVLYGDKEFDRRFRTDFVDYSGQKDFLLDAVLNALTIGHKDFAGEGIDLSALRFPTINGQDLKFVQGFIDSMVEKGKVMLGTAVSPSFRGDFDGDMINFFSFIKSLNRDKVHMQHKMVAEDQARVNKSIAAVVQDDPNKSSGVLISQQLLNQSQYKDVTEMSQALAKINKEKVGTLSNINTRVRKALRDAGYDETSGNTEDAALGILTRSFFEKLEQDAISSKKVEDRILKTYGAENMSAEEKHKFLGERYSELATVIEHMFDKDYVDENGNFGIRMLMNKMQQMGILGEGESLLGGEIGAQAIAEIQLLKGGNEALKKLGFKDDQLFHYTKAGDVNKAKITDATGKISDQQMLDVFDRVEGGIGRQLVSGGGAMGIGVTSEAAHELASGMTLVYNTLTKLMGADFAKDLTKLADAFGLIEDRVTSAKTAIDAEKEAEKSKIVVANNEAKAMGENTKSWKDYIAILEEAYGTSGKGKSMLSRDITKQTKTGKFSFMPLSKADLEEQAGLVKTSPTGLKNILFPYTNKTSGLDSGVLNDLLKQSTKGVKFTNKELVEKFGVENEATLMDAISGSIAMDLGNFSHRLAQGDDTGAKEIKEKIDKTLRLFNYTDQQIKDKFDTYEKAGENFAELMKGFTTNDTGASGEGRIVGYENVTAGISSDGKYLIGGYTDALAYRQRLKRNKMGDVIKDASGKDTFEDVYTIVDFKTHAGGGIKDEDIAQTLLYQDFLKKAQHDWMTDSKYAGMSDKQILQEFVAGLAQAAPFLDEKTREKIAKTYTEDDIRRIRHGAAIESSVFVADTSAKGGGKVQRYDLDTPEQNLIDALTNNPEALDDKQKLALEAYKEKYIKQGGFAGGIKTEEQAELEYVEALEKEYKIKLELLKLEAEKDKYVNNPEVLKAQNILIEAKKEELKLAKDVTKQAANNVKNNENKNKISSLREAEFIKQSRDISGGNAPRQQGFLEQLGYSGNGLTRMITQYFSLYRVIGKLRQEISKVIQITKQLDQAAINIRIVTGMNRKQVDEAIMSYSKLASQLGTTTTALTQSANEWLRQGYSISDSMKLVEETTKLSKLGMLDMSTATKVLTSTLKGFKMEASEAGIIVDKLTSLDMNYAASAGEIGEALSRTAAIAQQMGVSLDQTAAMVTTIMDVTQQSAEMAGTAMRSILSRYGNVKAGSFVSMMTDGEDLEKINDIEKVLGVLGIQIRNSRMEMRDMGDVLDELANKWNTLSSVEQNAIATAFAGESTPGYMETYAKNIFNCR